MSTVPKTPNELDLVQLDRRRQAIRERYLNTGEPGAPGKTDSAVATAGVDHLALICSDIEQTILFYTDVVQMRLTKVVANRDDPSSTHIFLDMGGGNLLAFFDFPRHEPTAAVRGIGAMHHVALKASSERYRDIVRNLKSRSIAHDIHGDENMGSVYFRDPDDILIEVKSRPE